jgi:integrase
VPRIALTDLAIRSLNNSEQTTYYYDTALPSFGIRVGKYKRSFVLVRGLERRRITLGQYPYLSLKEARLKAHAHIAQGLSPATSIKLQKALNEYLNAYEQTRRPNTAKETKRILEKYLARPFAHLSLDQIDTYQLTQVIDGLLSKPSEAIKAHSVISTFMTWAKRRGHVSENPLQGIPLPAKPKSRDRVLSDAELTRVLRAARDLDTPYGTIVLILAHTGLRKTEAATLLPERVTPETITIPKEIAKNYTELILPNTSTNT